jgi:hypothetical protein
LDKLTLGLHSWIVQDGNYGDFRRGETIEVAVEFYADEELSPTESHSVGAARIAGETYRICGHVTHAWDGGVVVDFGIQAFTTRTVDPLPPKGAYVVGDVHLGVDPFDYFESLHELPDFPPLIYTWRIERIELNTTPWLESSSRVIVRDATRQSWLEVAETHAWEDDGGYASYLLDCVRLDVLPKTTSRTAAG